MVQELITWRHAMMYPRWFRLSPRDGTTDREICTNLGVKPPGGTPRRPPLFTTASPPSDAGRRIACVFSWWNVDDRYRVFSTKNIQGRLETFNTYRSLGTSLSGREEYVFRNEFRSRETQPRAARRYDGTRRGISPRDAMRRDATCPARDD